MGVQASIVSLVLVTIVGEEMEERQILTVASSSCCSGFSISGWSVSGWNVGSWAATGDDTGETEMPLCSLAAGEL